MANTANEVPERKKQILRRIYLFSGIPEGDLEILAQMAVSKAFARQEVVFWEGREAQGFFLLTRGYVKLVKSSPDGKEYILRLVGPGETFAEAAVFSDAPYPASAITLEDCQTLFFPKGPFLRHLAASPTLARNMLATLSRLNLHLTRQLEDLSLKEVSARLARYILERCQEMHGKVETGLSFELPTTKTHLAAYLGTISETLSRTLSRFKSEGAIEMEKAYITILDPIILKKLARGRKI
ncbi:MAG: Crp/Fnr family transcriptional regulator [Deltaproteobacteria bacterium]|nr:Crp/Fnr family transcriptional regulator [Deltaproteobacteria bacterium]